MMKAEMASDTSRSRTQTATTGSGRDTGSWAVAGEDGGLFPTSCIVMSFYTNAESRDAIAEVRSQIAEVKPAEAKHAGTLSFSLLQSNL